MTINVPADQPTIQAGINAAHTGDTVLVAPGTYFENIDFTGKAITVTSSAGPATTIIDGGGLSATVLFKTSELRTSVLSGFTIRGGGPHQNVLDNGSGVNIQGAAPSILNDIISNNGCHGIEVNSSAPLIQNNIISGTTSTNGSYCSFNGSGILLIGNPLNGGAIQPIWSLHTIILGNTIEQNLHAISYDGGGILIWANEGPVIEGNIIRNNATTGQGGAIASYNSVAVAIIQNLILGNSATNVGAAIALHPPEATTGPFIGILANNTIAQNFFSGPTTSTNTPQGDVYLEGNLGQYALVNNIISSSMAFPSLVCGTTYNYLSITPLVIDHNDIYNSQGPTYGGACPDQTGTYGNISAPPQFVNPGTGNFQLSQGSPAIDAGNNSILPNLAALSISLTTDLANNRRIQDATGKGYPIIDMGAYEYAGQQLENPTTILITPSTFTATGGSNVTLTANLLSASGTPTGTVDFLEDGATFASGVIDSKGNVQVNASALTPGVHAFIATYAGQGVFAPAVSVKIYLYVSAYTTSLTLTSAPNPSLLNQSVTFTAHLTSPDNAILAPITLTDASTNTTLASLTPNSSGTASFTISTLTLGSHFITATYAGDTNHVSTSANVNQQVISGSSTTSTLTSSLNPAGFGQSVTFTATVTNTSSPSGAPSGTVVFSDGATILVTQPLAPSNLANAIATFSTSTLTVGSHTITATYNPAAGFAGSTASLTQTIIGLSTTAALTSSLNPANAGQSVTFTATVTSSFGTPTGSITLSDGVSLLGNQPLTPGSGTTATAIFPTSTLTAGTHTITATYVPTGAFSSGTAALTQVINALSSVTTLTAAPNPANFGQTVTLVAVVAGAGATPTGTVTFYDGATQLASTPTIAGQAPFTTSTLAVGTHTLTAVYAGNSIYATSTSLPFTETIKALPQDFTITLANSTVTIQTQHHLTTTVTLTSLSGFTDSLALTCANLPTYVTCKPTPNPAPLTANGTTTVSLYLDTDSVLGYARLNAPPPDSNTPASPINLALLLSPFTLIAAFAARRHSRLRLLVLVLAAIPISVVLTGCGYLVYPYAVPPSATPGTYTIPIIATAATTGLTHTTQLTLTITP